MNFAVLASTRSSCKRRKVGAVLVKDKNVLATGYNGAPTGQQHCSETGCLRDKLNVPSGENHELCRGLHAEQNAIIQAAYHGTSIGGADLYCTTFPCVICTKMLINAGILRVFYEQGYADDLAREMLINSSIELIKMEKGDEG